MPLLLQLGYLSRLLFSRCVRADLPSEARADGSHRAANIPDGDCDAAMGIANSMRLAHADADGRTIPNLGEDALVEPAPTTKYVRVCDSLASRAPLRSLDPRR